MRWVRAQSGQASTDYVAVLALVGALAAAGAAVAARAAPGLGGTVIDQVRRALCVVTGAACGNEDEPPCIVAAQRDDQHLAATVWFVRLDADHVLLRERLSDGTARVTVARRGGLGGELGVGAEGEITVRGRAVGLGEELRAALLGIAGEGRVYYAHDDRQADRIVRAVSGHGLPARILAGVFGGGGPPPDARYVEGGARAFALAGIARPIGGAQLSAISELVLGARRERASGETTIYLRPSGGADALVSAALGTATGGATARALLGLTVDRDHHPLRLSLLTSDELRGGVSLPAALSGLLGVGASSRASASGGALGGPATTGRRWELDARLDLGDPAVGAAWDAYRRSPVNPAAIGALGQQLGARARLDARLYATTGTSSGFAGGVAAGPGLGLEVEQTLQRSSLLAAAARPPGGVWEPRTDCVGAQ